MQASARLSALQRHLAAMGLAEGDSVEAEHTSAEDAVRWDCRHRDEPAGTPPPRMRWQCRPPPVAAASRSARLLLLQGDARRRAGQPDGHRQPHGAALRNRRQRPRHHQGHRPEADHGGRRRRGAAHIRQRVRFGGLGAPGYCGCAQPQGLVSSLMPMLAYFRLAPLSSCSAHLVAPSPLPAAAPPPFSYVNTSACKSRVSYIDGDRGILRYRGYPIEQLAERSNFLEARAGGGEGGREVGGGRKQGAAGESWVAWEWAGSMGAWTGMRAATGPFPPLPSRPSCRSPTWWCMAACPPPTSTSAGQRR